MRICAIIFIGCFSYIGTEAQKIKIQRETISGSEIGNLGLKENEKLRVIAIQNESVNRTDKGFSLVPKEFIKVDKNEELIYSSVDVAYKRRVNANGSVEFVKQRRGVDEARIEVQNEEEVRVLDNSGVFMTCDYLDGKATKYSFYSPDFGLIKEYRPYTNSFWTIAAYNANTVAIYSQLGNAKKYKVSTLNHRGDVISEREFEVDGYFVGNIGMLSGKIHLLYTSGDTGKAKLVSLNSTLGMDWEIKFSDAVTNNALSYSDKRNLLLLNFHESVVCVDLKDGNQIWNVRVNQLTNSTSKAKYIESNFIEGDNLVAIAVGDYQSSNRTFSNNSLAIVQGQTGVIMHKEFVSGSNAPVKIVSGEKAFIIFRDSEIIKYTF